MESGAQIGLAILMALLGAFLGAAGGAWGVSWALREKVMRLERDHGSRLQATESRIGIDKENRPTGNGLLGDVKAVNGRIDAALLREARDVRRIDARNQRQHPTTDENEDR